MAKINDLPLLSNPTEDMYCLVGKEDLQKVPWSAIMGQIGAPYIATTVAGMTDKTRVYVYQGSESGYTSGNWYYWNGSAWTSGGTYNSAAVNTDKTLTQSDKPADSAIVGKEIGSLKESSGDLIYKYQENNGFVAYDSGIISNLGDIRCTDFLPIKKGMTVKVSGISFEPSDYRGLAIYDKNKIFKNGYQYSKNNEYTFDVNEDGYLRATIVGQQIKVIANQNGIAKALIEVSEDTQKEIKREVNTLISEEYGKEKQLDIVETQEGYAVKSDGTKENAGWISSLKFNCEAYQKIYTKNAHAHKNYPWIVLFDSNNKVIGQTNVNEDQIGEIIAPYNASYGWMNCYELVSYAQTQYLIRTIKNEYLPEKLKKIIPSPEAAINLVE